MSLTQEDLQEMYHKMVLTRELGNMLFTLARQGRILYANSARGLHDSHWPGGCQTRRGRAYGSHVRHDAS